jgi:kynureninase
MKIKIEDLGGDINPLAKYYSNFRVSERLLLTGHSHQAWPDVAFDGQKQAWLDAAEKADEKWGRAFEKAQIVKDAYRKLLNDDSGHITLAGNTHELVIKFLSALDLKSRPKIVTTDGEFHSIRRQLDRLSEEGIEIVKVASLPAENLADRILPLIDDKTSAVMVSKVLFSNAHIVGDLSEVQKKCDIYGTLLLVDAYHALNAIPFDIRKEGLEGAFIIGGGYKYMQFGEGNCFLRFPAGREFRPVVTGWFSEFSAIGDKKKPGEVIYGTGDDMFAGSTYDPTSQYRAAEVVKFFEEMGLTDKFLRDISQQQIKTLISEFEKWDLNPEIIRIDKSVSGDKIAAFLAFKSERAGEIHEKLKSACVLTDFRADNLRFGPAPYHSDNQLKESINILAEIVKKDFQ